MDDDSARADREEVAHLNRCEDPLSEIAEAIGFDKSTVSRELRRNTSGWRRYRATTAQRLADKRAKSGRQNWPSSR